MFHRQTQQETGNVGQNEQRTFTKAYKKRGAETIADHPAQEPAQKIEKTHPKKRNGTRSKAGE